MDWYSALILGIVQGLTELLPVSSSGHLVLVETLMGLRLTDLSFEITVHVATAAAICFFLRSELASILAAFKPRSAAVPGGDSTARGRRLLLALVIGTIPAVAVGYVAYDVIERVFHTVGLTLAMLPATGVFLLLTRLGKDRGLGVSPLLALVIGVAQAVAIVPGISRSGLTVGAALLLGVKKEEAVKFSFLLSLPAILGGAVLKLAKAASGTASDVASSLAAPNPSAISHVGTTALVVGAAAAFVFALIAAKTLLGVVRRGRLEYFGYYCILAGVAFLILTRS